MLTKKEIYEKLLQIKLTCKETSTCANCIYKDVCKGLSQIVNKPPRDWELKYEEE